MPVPAVCKRRFAIIVPVAKFVPNVTLLAELIVMSPRAATTPTVFENVTFPAPAVSVRFSTPAVVALRVPPKVMPVALAVVKVVLAASVVAVDCKFTISAVKVASRLSVLERKTSNVPEI